MKAPLSNVLRICWLLALLMIPPALFAQEEMEMEAEGMAVDAECIPASLETSYDKFKADTTEQQVAIWYSFAREEFKHEQYQKAIPYYWKVVLNDNSGRFRIAYSKLATAYFNLARANSGGGYLDSTLIVTYRGLEKYPDYGSLHFMGATIHRTLGRPSCAIPHYVAMLEENPQEGSYWKILAGLYLEIGDEKALEAQQRYIDLNPDDAEAQTMKIQMLQSFGIDPITEMKSLFDQDPTDINNAMRYGREALIVGQSKEALRAFSAVLEQDPQYKDALLKTAEAYENLGQFRDAVGTYQKLLEIDGNDQDVLCNIAAAYAQLKQFSTARNYAARAKRVDASYGRAYIVMGDIYVAAAEHCNNQRGDNNYSYDDKLVFEMARAEYAAARKDPNFAARANTLYNGLRDFARSVEDKHMFSNRETIKDSCYDWMK